MKDIKNIYRNIMKISETNMTSFTSFLYLFSTKIVQLKGDIITVKIFYIKFQS